MTARWATSEDLAHYLSDAPPESADELLARAARVVDRLARLLSWEPVSELDRTPADLEIRAALRDATCAQVQAWIDNGQAGSLAGAGRELADAGLGSITFGGVSLVAAGNAAAGKAGGRPLDWRTPAPAALDELQRAGLWPPAVSTR